MVSYHLAMRGVHWSTVSGDIKYLSCHETSQNYMIDSSGYITTLPILAVIAIVIYRDMLLVCQLI